MAKGIRKCRVCGKEYEYCKTHRRDTIFRWQDVACCPEHAAEYFALIEASRAPKTEEPVIDVDDEVDPLFEEEFDDSDEELDLKK